MTGLFAPSHILIAGGLLAAMLPARFRGLFTLGAPTLALVALFALPSGTSAQIGFMGAELVLLRVDALSFLFGLIFLIASLLCGIYGLDEKTAPRMQASASLVYAGAAVGAVFAGDLITLFVWWEMTAIGSVFLVLAPGHARARSAAARYLVIQVLSGVLLIAGTAIRAAEGDTLIFDLVAGTDPLSGASRALDEAGTLILLAFGIKAAFPFLNGWLQDSYPEATPFGTVALSVFTTKLAIYALARGFPGYEPLIWIGAIMTVFPVFFAVIENDLRRVLAFSLNNQLGFMVAAIGIGTRLALNGAATHAFAHILYKALLFMSMGAVLRRAGTVKASELGGLWRAMPLTCAFCIVGAMSISAFPLLSGFATKSLTMSAAENSGLVFLWIMLLFASAGVLEHSGIKIPYFAFFAHDQRKTLAARAGAPVREAPWNMLLAMGLAAAACIGLGIWYEPLYRLAPYADVALAQHPYAGAHVTTQLQLLFFATLAFVLLMRFGFYPAERDATILNADWFYRRLLPRILSPVLNGVFALTGRSENRAMRLIDRMLGVLYRATGPRGTLARSWGPSFGALMVASLLGVFLGTILLLEQAGDS